MTIDEIKECVGLPYRKLDQEGKAYGCMMPVYLLYPEIPRYKWPSGNNLDRYFIRLLKKHGYYVNQADIQPGDVVAFRMPLNFLHVGVYLGNDEIIHCMTDETMEICRLSFISRRIEGVFRWVPDFCQE